MAPIQVVALLFALAMGYLSFVGFRRRQFGPGGLALWEGIWFGLALVTVAPGLFQRLIQPLHLARLMDLVVVTGMLALGAITYRNYAQLQRLRAQLERLVREEALNNLMPGDAGGDRGTQATTDRL